MTSTYTHGQTKRSVQLFSQKRTNAIKRDLLSWFDFANSCCVNDKLTYFYQERKKKLG